MTGAFPPLSAWTLPSVPPLVQSLESEFLAGVRSGVADTPYLSTETRSGITNLLRREMPARLVGDALMISYASEWARYQTQRLGASNVSCVWHGAERLFEPVASRHSIPDFPEFEAKKSRFLEDFGHLHLMSRAILEVRCPSETVYDFRSRLLLPNFSQFEDAVRPLGFFPCTRPDLDPHQEEFVIRFFSLTVLELGLYVFLGTAAPRFCLGSGEPPPRVSHEIRNSGYRPVGMPLYRRKSQGVWLSPFDFLWNGIGRGLSPGPVPPI